jgi:hypothetical protein
MVRHHMFSNAVQMLTILHLYLEKIISREQSHSKGVQSRVTNFRRKKFQTTCLGFTTSLPQGPNQYLQPNHAVGHIKKNMFHHHHHHHHHRKVKKTLLTYFGLTACTNP